MQQSTNNHNGFKARNLGTNAVAAGSLALRALPYLPLCRATWTWGFVGWGKTQVGATRGLSSKCEPSPRAPGGSTSASDLHCIVLLGCTGHGKSHSANTLSGKQAFETSDALASKTKRVEQSGPFEHNGSMFNVIDTPGFFDTTLELDEIQKRLVVISNFAPKGLSAIVIVSNGRATPENQKVLNYVTQQFGSDALAKYGILLFPKTDKKPLELHHEIQDLPATSEYKNIIQHIPKERLMSLPAAAESGWNSWWTHAKCQEDAQRTKILNTVVEMHRQRQLSSTGAHRDFLDCENFRKRRIVSEEQIMHDMNIAKQRADWNDHLRKTQKAKE